MTRVEKPVVMASLTNYRRQFGGRVPTYVVRHVAEVNDVTERTVWRWLKECDPNKEARAAFTIEYEHLVTIRSHLNLRAAHKALFPSRKHNNWVSYPTFHRAWQALPPSVRAGVLEGWEGMARHHVYVSNSAPHRNHRWHVDHTQADVWVCGDRGTIFRPWITVVRDSATSLILAATVYQGNATEDSIAEIFATAASPHDYLLNDTPVTVGGLPTEVTFDNAKEHFAKAVTHGLMVLGVVAAPTKAYAKHQNGTAENTFSVLNKQLLAGLPGYRHGGQDENGNDLVVSAYPDKVSPEEVLSFEVFQRHIDAWVQNKNAAQPNTRLGGRTPLEAWVADPTEIEWVPVETIRALMRRASFGRVVNGDGIHINGETYTAPELNAYRAKGLKLNIRYLTRETRFIEVFDGDTWLCRAINTNLVTEAHRQKTLDYRKQDLAMLKQINADANRDRIHRAAVFEGQTYDRPDLDETLTAHVDAAVSNVVNLHSGHMPATTPEGDPTDVRNDTTPTVVVPTFERIDPTTLHPPKRQRAQPTATRKNAERDEKARDRIRNRPGSDFGGINA